MVEMKKADQDLKYQKVKTGMKLIQIETIKLMEIQHMKLHLGKEEKRYL
jgi:hypothetical protein